MKLKIIKILICCVIIFINPVPLSSSKIESKENNISSLIDSIYAENKESVGILVHVESPNNGLSWSYAVGYNNKEKKTSLNVSQPVLIASNTKTYVAATILKLIQNNKIKLNDPISKFLSTKTSLQLINNGYSIDSITIKHLLSHTSGIVDYVNDKYFELVNDRRQYHWKRDEQIDSAMSNSNTENISINEFNYADVNYLLLTELIEKITNKDFQEAIRILLDFNKFGFDKTWFYTLEEVPNNTKELAHQYWEKYNWDSYDLNPSWDLYGGGGLASTVEEVSLFYSYLFNEKIIRSEVLNKMVDYVLPKNESNYALGIRILDFDGYKAYYHGGFWGTDVIHFPQLDLTISIFTLNKESRTINSVLTKLILREFL